MQAHTYGNIWWIPPVENGPLKSENTHKNKTAHMAPFPTVLLNASRLSLSQIVSPFTVHISSHLAQKKKKKKMVSMVNLLPIRIFPHLQ
ncbi:hypothetical protein POVWA1_014660 [Plasmodium ovale wallikeri]|uniref:Uncharacterized protein n=1 Tax=Plasmodium ovale wallikeri TaxID=864142 RepID=A0A1A8YN04_PLAOA|nr:hypothetical protein POVWA1_014660 [Plasmodium ovale wallikeri]